MKPIDIAAQRQKLLRLKLHPQYGHNRLEAADALSSAIDDALQTLDALDDALQIIHRTCQIVTPGLEETPHAAQNLPDACQRLVNSELYLTRKITAINDAHTQLDDVYDLLRRSQMPHGDCDSAKRYNGQPKACTACMANLKLKELAAQWKGRLVRCQ